jgi:hypothetical protein
MAISSALYDVLCLVGAVDCIRPYMLVLSLGSLFVAVQILPSPSSLTISLPFGPALTLFAPGCHGRGGTHHVC